MSIIFWRRIIIKYQVKCNMITITINNIYVLLTTHHYLEWLVYFHYNLIMRYRRLLHYPKFCVCFAQKKFFKPCYSFHSSPFPSADPGCGLGPPLKVMCSKLPIKVGPPLLLKMNVVVVPILLQSSSIIENWLFLFLIIN